MSVLASGESRLEVAPMAGPFGSVIAPVVCVALRSGPRTLTNDR